MKKTDGEMRARDIWALIGLLITAGVVGKLIQPEGPTPIPTFLLIALVCGVIRFVIEASE